MRARPLLASLFTLVVCTSAFAQSGDAGTVTIGSPAPALSVKKWLKGTPVNQLDPNKTYVVEFWATWCGPCIQTIPHLTDLAKKNPDVTFMGIGIWEDDGEQIPAFVEKMGAKMDYNVGYSGNQDGMAQTWMAAAGQNGIPSAFIIKEGKVMWIGHPMAMDKPLEEIKAGTFDVAEYKRSFEARAEKARAQMAIQKAFAQIDADYEAGKRVEAKAALTKFVAEHPEMEEASARMRFGWLATEDPKAWEAQAKTYAASKDEKEFGRIAYFAISKAQKPETAPLARKAAGILLKAKPNDFMALQYARAVYKRTGDTELQLDATKRLLAVLPNSPAKDDVEFKGTLEKERAELEAKLAKSGK